VTWFTKIIAVLLLALWVPVTMHCELEAAVQSSLLQCCCGDESAQRPANCADNVCSSVETGFYKVEENENAIAPVLVFAVFVADIFDLPTPEPALHPATPEPDPPPELPRSWQFSYRAALSPRAPSFA
jgi:hypothetical protein